MLPALALLLAAAPGEVPPLQDKEPPPAATSGLSSPRLAAPVLVRLDPKFPEDGTPLTPQEGGQARGTTGVPRQALSTYALAIARRHFEEATWADKPGKGRELVIKSVTLLVQRGPVYQAQVVVDRVENGKRLGQATGTGVAVPDRTGDRLAAGFAGPFAALAAEDANRPKAAKDARSIEIAVLKSLDAALVQLAAYWASEQANAELMRTPKQKK
jgi:hypothetical protein